MTEATQVYHVFIRASAEDIWRAITSPERTAQYFYGSAIETTPEARISRGPGGEDWGTDTVAEFEPPRRLVHEWRSSYDPDLADEPASRVTWEIEPQDAGYCKLTVTHDQLEGAPKTAESVYGEGWMLVISSLKTLLETGKGLEG